MGVVLFKSAENSSGAPEVPAHLLHEVIETAASNTATTVIAARKREFLSIFPPPMVTNYLLRFIT
jgi:hypothetical protein